jgi:hypothetical protein
MNKFVIASLAAFTAHAEYQELLSEKNNGDKTLYYKSQPWSSTTSENGNRQVNIPNNNNIFIKSSPYDGTTYAEKPYIRGGAIQYTVDLSSMGCGCVAGVYAVAMNDYGCGEDSLSTDNPMCPSIDIMQANPYGFNTAVNPCSNGTCDVVSQCQYDMAVEGAATYGDDAYGPNGTKIDTNRPFTVKTEFLSKDSYSTLWGIRTRITQDDNEIMMQANCEDYIASLSGDIEGGMGFVFSAWDNRDGR